MHESHWIEVGEVGEENWGRTQNRTKVEVGLIPGKKSAFCLSLISFHDVLRQTQSVFNRSMMQITVPSLGLRLLKKWYDRKKMPSSVIHWTTNIWGLVLVSFLIESWKKLQPPFIYVILNWFLLAWRKFFGLLRVRLWPCVFIPPRVQSAIRVRTVLLLCLRLRTISI